MRLLRMLIVGAAILAMPVAAAAQCTVSGTIAAVPNVGGPDLGAWAYTLDLAWDTGGPHGLSHFDLVLDLPDGTCDCGAFADALGWESPAGSSTGEPDCSVAWGIDLECQGDPSVPGEEGILLMFEPLPEQTCTTGPSGTATIVFYSDLAPSPIGDGTSLLLEKYATESCWGDLSGVFPAVPCGPVSTEGATWGSLKALYGR